MKAAAKRRAGFESLRKFVRGLRDVASGAVVANAIVRFSKYLRGRVKGELSRHVKTGLALNSATVAPSTKAVDVTLQRYRRYIKWSFAKGIPRSALERGRKIVAEEIKKALDKGGM